MKTTNFSQVFFGLLLMCAAFISGACSDNDSKDDTVTLSVGTDKITLGATVGAAETFTITTQAAWTATLSGTGFSLDKTSGTGDATIQVTATAASADGDEKQLGTIAIAAKGVSGTKTVSVSQSGATPEPLPEKVTITLDFAQGPTIATPALPATSEAALTGRGEFTMGGYKFAVFADAAENGKYFWVDNSQYSSSIPEPNKGLYFSKLGAYIEFPAIVAKTLSTVSYTPTTSQGDASLDLMNADGTDAEYALDFEDDGTSVYTLINPKINAGYRIEVINKKNAQLAKLVLTYTNPAQ